MVTRFFFNHIGIEAGPSACALVARERSDADTVEVITAAGWQPVCTLPLSPPVTGFRDLSLSRVDLSGLSPGRYVLRYQGEQSHPLFIEHGALLRRSLNSLLNYFYDQRCQDPWNEKDKSVSFFGGRSGSVDVHGGWYDASGDLSKYLSHLSYANFMNPQQTPMVVWGLLEHFEQREGSHAAGVAERLLDEARYGADFLCRMQDPAGYFYITVFDQWSKFLDRRVICSYKTQKGELLDTYQAGYRQGGGVSIAALARAGRILNEKRYVEAAERGFAHLQEHNLSYLDDGVENVIDDYCALLAAVELFAATNQNQYLEQLRQRAQALVERLVAEQPATDPDSALQPSANASWLRADNHTRPYYHAAEAGLPALALLHAASVDQENAKHYQQAAARLLRFELAVSAQTTNPFGYARQFVQDINGRRYTSFFIPHQNETGYWWQGENARLGSLAAAAGRMAQITQDADFRADLYSYAYSQLDWISGKNPFDSCMMAGLGRNNRNYMDAWPNIVGGICNGITSGFDDETDVDFGRNDVDGDHSWRWFEQWLPHATWFLIALAELSPSQHADAT